MSTRKRLAACSARFLVVMTILISSGCVIVPVPVKPKLERLEVTGIADDIRVSVGPRQLLEEVGEKIVKAKNNIEIIDALEFRDTAFPEGGWRLVDLLDPETARRTADNLDVSHLVLIQPGKLNEWEETLNVFVPLAFGVGAGEETSSLTVTIVDLYAPDELRKTRVTAVGKARMFMLVIYGIGTEPMTAGSVYKGIASAILNEMEENERNGPVRIALLATEKVGEDLMSAGDRHFPESCGDNQLPYQDDERNRHSYQGDNTPVSANSKVETGEKKADNDHYGRDKVAHRCRLEVGEVLVVLAVESCASHLDVSDNGH